MGELREPSSSTWARAGERLARRRSFRIALTLLVLLGALAVYAPLLASDRPLWLVGVHLGDYERARKSLVPVTRALVTLLAHTEPEFLAARAPGSTQTYAAALEAERAALATRLARLEE